MNKSKRKRYRFLKQGQIVRYGDLQNYEDAFGKRHWVKVDWFNVGNPVSPDNAFDQMFRREIKSGPASKRPC